MNILQSIVLGVVEGVTEFLPVSSTGHLTIAESLLGLKVDDKAITAYTAVIQVGAIAAVWIYFREELWRLIKGALGGLRSAEGRQTQDWRWAWAIFVGSIPIAVIGLGAKSFIEGSLRSLWVVGAALIIWSAAMVFAEKRATQARGEAETTVVDILAIGLFQCIALIPGVSRSGATISGGLLRGLDRVTATRLSFFLSIPALTGAGLLELKKSLSGGVGLAPTLVGTIVAFVVAYISIAWLLKFVAHHSIATFVPYRVALGATVLVVLAVT